MVFVVSGFIGVRDLEADLVMFVKTVTLQGVHAYSRLQVVLKVNKTKQILSAGGSGLADQSDLLEARIWTEDVCITTNYYD